ncbi:hypothetical protein EVAR_3323_1 [Eumeta japonica]|uniref:Uncharacterized protein n=1 Tax=Eumeta variegata TaxID=151549 RepID=A0A4C1SW11_EUMVA|nr:hypothetical protein EVAR_3323_1 [Eumeta japonica]
MGLAGVKREGSGSGKPEHYIIHRLSERQSFVRCTVVVSARLQRQLDDSAYTLRVVGLVESEMEIENGNGIQIYIESESGEKVGVDFNRERNGLESTAGPGSKSRVGLGLKSKASFVLDFKSGL